LQSSFPENRFALTGAIRRQDEVVAFVEIVCDLGKAILEAQFQSVSDAVIEEEPNNTIVVRVPEHPVMKFYLAHADFYRTVFLTTGSAAFTQAFLEQYTLSGAPETEEEIFEQNKLAYISPP